MNQFVRYLRRGLNGVNLNTQIDQLRGTWTQQSPFGGNALITDTGAVRAENASSAFYRSSGTPGSADYRSFLTLEKLSSLSGQFFGTGVRMSTSADTVYFWRYNEDAGILEYFKRVAGVSTQIDGGAVTVAMVNGDTVVHDIVGSTPATIRVLVNNVVKLSITDSSITAAGKMGIFLFGLMSNSAGTHFKDIIGDDNVAANAITLISPEPKQVIKRSGTTADIPISGYYVGTATSIEASFNGGAYQTIVASPANGKFSGTLTGQAQGQGTLTVRLTNDHTATATITVSIGVLLAVGPAQSNGGGRATNNQVYTGTAGYGVMLGNDGIWQDITDPTDATTNQLDAVSDDSTVGGTPTGSVWPLVVNLLVAAYGVPVGIIQGSMGATLIDPDWQVDPANHSNRATLLGSLINRVLQYVGSVTAFLAWIGESDALAGTLRTTFRNSLAAVAAVYHSDFSVPLIVPKIQNCSGADVTQINLGIGDAWGNVTGILPGPDLSDLPTDDSFHLMTDGHVATAATRWANAILAQFPATDTTPPTLSTATGDVTGATLTNAYSEIVSLANFTDYTITGGAAALTLISATGSGDDSSWMLAFSRTVYKAETALKLQYAGTGTKDVAGNFLATIVDKAIVNNSDVKCAVPGGLAAGSRDTAASITWTANTEPVLKDYRIWTCATVNGTYTVAATVLAGSTSYRLTGLTNGVAVFVKITSRDTADNESAKSTAVSVTPAVQPKHSRGRGIGLGVGLGL